MLSQCRICTRWFDSDIHLEDCPHPLVDAIRSHVNQDQLAHAKRLLGKRVRATFLPPQMLQPAMWIQAVTPDGLVVCDGVRGEFQPHWFVEAPE